MYFSYQLYQAGRMKSRREQLEADARAGERAKAVSGLWHWLVPRDADGHRSASVRLVEAGEQL